ncbi:MAG: aldehyde dehydrogenase [Ilumatobacteraceae bacterium]|nr:aldehyde dehydrogenase [Ilumatobacteraceae bacterium]
MPSWEHLYIGGQWVQPSATSTIDVVNPFSEELVGTVPEAANADVDAAVTAANAAFDGWARTPVAERVVILRRLLDGYAARMDEMAELITDEMGSPTSFAKIAQAPIAWMTLSTFLGYAETYPWHEPRQGAFGNVVVRREPVGVVAAIVPWNVPQFVTMTKLAPALLAGNPVILKPAPETPLNAFVLAEIADAAGLPAGLLNVLPAGREVGEYLVSHPGINKVAFTGSTAAGRRIASICGEQLKRCSLELGGKSASIVLDDANLENVVSGLRMASFMNNGQACVAQTRILASKKRYGEVVDALAEMTASLKIGDPKDPATEIGPLVAERQQERVEKYIALGQEEGARVVVGGNGRPLGFDHGWFVQPTLFANVTNDMRIAQEEIFGPVLTVIPFDDVDDAVRIANDSDYGLSGSVWSADLDLAMDVATRVRTGTYGINSGSGMDLGAPFGGYKASGLGRELGPEGINAYTEYKTISVPA